jgi:hypothetical protein
MSSDNMALRDITNLPPISTGHGIEDALPLHDRTNTSPLSTGKKVVKKRLSDGTHKVYKYTGSRKHIELVFKDESEKLQFDTRLDKAKSSLGCKSVKDTLTMMLEKFDTVTEPSPSLAESALSGVNSHTHQHIDYPPSGENTGHDEEPMRWTHDEQHSVPPSDTSHVHQSVMETTHGQFICQYTQVFQLIHDITFHQSICDQLLHPTETSQNGHVAQLLLKCSIGHHVRWASSSTMGNNFSVNYKLLVAYICSGITPIEYQRISDFADIGQPTQYFRNKTIVTISEIVNVLTDESMQGAVFDEKEAAKTRNMDGISIMTDARHGCRKNSYTQTIWRLGS